MHFGEIVEGFFFIEKDFATKYKVIVSGLIGYMELTSQLQRWQYSQSYSWYYFLNKKLTCENYFNILINNMKDNKTRIAFEIILQETGPKGIQNAIYMLDNQLIIN